MTTLITRLDNYHQPNTPRTHDGQGGKLDEPAQCQGCLRSWPCETRQLLSIINRQGEEIRRLSDLAARVQRTSAEQETQVYQLQLRIAELSA